MTSESNFMTAVDGALVVVVRVDDQHVRRVVRMSLSAAEGIVTRARARGLEAEIVLCRLEPVRVIPIERGDVAA